MKMPSWHCAISRHIGKHCQSSTWREKMVQKHQCAWTNTGINLERRECPEIPLTRYLPSIQLRANILLSCAEIKCIMSMYIQLKVIAYPLRKSWGLQSNPGPSMSLCHDSGMLMLSPITVGNCLLSASRAWKMHLNLLLASWLVVIVTYGTRLVFWNTSLSFLLHLHSFRLVWRPSLSYTV